MPEFVVECRKHGIRYVLGTQSKYQITEQYGEGARAILAQPKLKIFYRCNEPEAAQWVSQNTGSEEATRTQVSESLSTDMQGRDSVSFQNLTDNHVLFTKEQIMSLPDLHAIWRFGDAAVPFKLRYINREAQHPEFVPRLDKPTAKKRTEPKVEAQAPAEMNDYSSPAAAANLIKASTNLPTPHTEKSTEKPDENKSTASSLEPPDFSNEIRLDF